MRLGGKLAAPRLLRYKAPNTATTESRKGILLVQGGVTLRSRSADCGTHSSLRLMAESIRLALGTPASRSPLMYARDPQAF